MRYLKYLISIILFFILATSNVWANQTVQLLSKRHRTEKNWVEYRISLKNTSENPIVNPDIHYYASDTVLSVAIDYISNPYTVTPSVTPVSSKTSDIKLTVHGTLAPGKKVNINFRIHHKKWKNYDFKKDWSHQRNANVSEPNYFMTVYDASHKILWGSDPIYGNYNTGDVVTWNDRGLNTAVTRYNGGNEYIPAGRFWLFKDTPLSPKERDLLAQRGISKLSIGKSRGKIVAVFKSNSNIQKKAIDSLIAGFYNAIPIADTVPIKVHLTNEDLYSETEICDAKGTCHKEITTRTDFETNIRCWEDVSINECISTVQACGGENIGVARGFLVATVAKDSLQCLGKKRKIETLDIVRTPALSNDKGREAVNIDSVQNSEEWLNALQKDRADFDWLKGVEYTGDSILVGIYDGGPIDFDHPDFNEYDSSEHLQARIMQPYEYFGFNYPKAQESLIANTKKREFGTKNNASQHPTSVAGYLGGNGNQSKNFQYRGVAPKVHFYQGSPFGIINQIGHVVNHSHINDDGRYQSSDFSMDEAIFKNWKSYCTKLKESPSNCIEGDTLPKTVVFSAHNYGHPHKENVMLMEHSNQGYHSIMINAKNPIVVGNMSAEEKIRAYSSSMGPTFDGRIKPDVMAPGVSSQIIVDEKHPFEVLIDYIKFYRANENIPYLNIDFEKNNLKNGESYFTACDIKQLTGNNNVLDCKASDLDNYNKMVRPQLYFSWALEDTTTILPTDTIEIRYKKITGAENTDHIFGAMHFSKNSITNSSPKVYTILPLSNDFETIRIKMTSISKATNIKTLRVDFNFERGTITPEKCYGESCGYLYLGAGGTSQAAPFVSGVAALMYQKFHKQTGDPLDKHSMRNSTTKALLIHSAIDMEDSEKAHLASNPDLNRAHNDGKFHFTPYGKGPDFATGWGYIDGKAALDLISNYNNKIKEFPKFKEIEIGNGFEKRWTINVDSARQRLRTTLVWDDAPGFFEEIGTITQNSKEPKLVNDLDMLLISPSGKYYYPWRLDPLPTDFLDSLESGLENIHESDVDSAYNDCNSNEKLGYKCFDHLNNVEVVDVDNPELGKWQIVVFGHSVTEFNNDSLNAQVATLVSDLPIKEGYKPNTTNNCKVTSGYAPQTDYSCTYKLGKDLVYYVTFHDSTSVGSGDDIVLTDGEGKNIGIYVGNELAGKTVKVKSSKLTVTLHSDNDKSQGWGFDVTGIHSVNHAILKMPFEAIKKKRRTP